MEAPSMRPVKKLLAEFGRPYAIATLALSVMAAVAWVFLDEVLLKTKIGAWPMLIGSSAIAVFVAWRTRDWLIAPLCCVLATMSGDLMAGMVRDWAYAQVPMAFSLSLAFSVPALLVALFGTWQARSRAMHTLEFEEASDRNAI
jgi:urea transporter